MIDWTELKGMIASLATKIAGKPDLRWAVVLSADPLTIRLDADTEPIVGTPSTLVAGLRTGDRVWVAVQNRRVTILGRARGAPPPRSGTLTVPTGTLGQVGTTGVYASTITTTVPAVAPPGHVLMVDALETGSGYGAISMSSTTPGLTSTTVRLRFTQPGSNSAQSVRLLWRIIPTTD
ncbi:hypothetical protein JD276_14020 [Leucobacter sp. CSA1]|uniref:Uncharacterized protein n=1 Tax=Leucobacter chromiisoli TaxID=2796471 RepID=A0A934Q8E6_9MICO|nr:hypothetical protein [Leucobacter chromiisoli]MBK0420150.1 hypothetical protein [Leucobacter chromiisoli]